MMGFGSGCNKSKQRAQEDAAWTDDSSGVCQVACERLQLTAAIQPLTNHHLQPLGMRGLFLKILIFYSALPAIFKYYSLKFNQLFLIYS